MVDFEQVNAGWNVAQVSSASDSLNLSECYKSTFLRTTGKDDIG